MKKLATIIIIPLLVLITLLCCACNTNKPDNDQQAVTTDAPALSEEASEEPAATPEPTSEPTSLPTDEPTPEPSEEPTDEELVLELAWERLERFNRLYGLKFTKDMAAGNIMVNKEYYGWDERGAEVCFYDTESELLAKFNFTMLSYEGVWEPSLCFITNYTSLDHLYDREKLDSDLTALLLEDFTGEVTADTLEAEGYPSTEAGAELYVKDLIAGSFTDCPADNYFHCSDGHAILKETVNYPDSPFVVIVLRPDDIAPITSVDKIGWDGFYVEENSWAMYSLPEIKNEYWGYFILHRDVEVTRSGDTFAYRVTNPLGSM